MKASTRYAIVAAMGLAALMLTAAPANAVTGRLVLHDSDPSTILPDPDRGCYSVVAGFTMVHNRTDTPVTVYDGARCTGLSRVVPAGAGMPVGARLSVWVPS